MTQFISIINPSMPNSLINPCIQNLTKRHQANPKDSMQWWDCKHINTRGKSDIHPCYHRRELNHCITSHCRKRRRVRHDYSLLKPNWYLLRTMPSIQTPEHSIYRTNASKYEENTIYMHIEDGAEPKPRREPNSNNLLHVAETDTTARHSSSSSLFLHQFI